MHHHRPNKHGGVRFTWIPTELLALLMAGSMSGLAVLTWGV